MPFRGSQTLLLSAAAVALLVTCGCAHSVRSASANAGGPTLGDERPTHGRGGTNPNAPFMLVDRTPQPSQPLASAAEAVPCSAQELAEEEVGADVNGSERRVRLAFVNNGPTACSLGGYPSITLLNDAGEPVAGVEITHSSYTALTAAITPLPPSSPGQAQTQAAPAPPPDAAAVLLTPHDEAWFVVEWNSGEPGSGCPVVSGVEIAAPGTSQVFRIKKAFTVCSGQVQVTALRSSHQAE